MTQKVSSTMLASSGTMPAWDGSALTGISTNAALTSVKANLALNFFLDSIDSSRAIQYLADGFVDQFEDQLGVDDTNSTDEAYDASGDFYRVGSISYNASTVSLYHFNGSDTSTTMTDDLGHASTAAGNAQLDTSQKKFGTASLLLDGTGDEVKSDATSTDWTMGTGDFTAECWIRPAAIGSPMIVIGNRILAFTIHIINHSNSSFGNLR